MDVSFLNILLVLASIGLGAIGWLAPAYTMEVIDLHPGRTPMGRSEIRAASGALFVGMGLGALYLGTPAAFAMIGFCWGGAAIGRATSILMDGMTPKKLGFFACEAVVAVIALAINL